MKPSNMTDEQLRVRVAELLGWKILPKNPWWSRWIFGNHCTQTPDGRTLCGYLPDYPRHLNRCYQMEDSLPKSLEQKYLDALCLRVETHGNKRSMLWGLTHAIARQRCEAFVEVMEGR